MPDELEELKRRVRAAVVAARNAHVLANRRGQDYVKIPARDGADLVAFAELCLDILDGKATEHA